MLLEGKVVTAAATAGLAVALALWGSLGPVAQEVIVAAAFVGAVKVLGGAVRTSVRRGREVHEAVTSDLPDRMTGVEGDLLEVKERLDDGQQRFRDIERQLEVLGNREAAVLHGALHAVAHPTAPRPSRSTDQARRTGWRE